METTHKEIKITPFNTILTDKEGKQSIILPAQINVELPDGKIIGIYELIMLATGQRKDMS